MNILAQLRNAFPPKEAVVANPKTLPPAIMKPMGPPVILLGPTIPPGHPLPPAFTPPPILVSNVSSNYIISEDGFKVSADSIDPNDGTRDLTVHDGTI